MVTYRMWVPNRKGRADLHFSAPEIQLNSVVHISVSEATDLGTPTLTAQNFNTVFGSASITLQNVSVRQGAVDFYVHVDWPDPLHLVTDITILDPPAQVIIGT